MAAGTGFTLVLTSPDDKDKVANLPVFESKAPEEAAVEEEAPAKGGKRKAETAPKAAAGKAKKGK